MPACGTFTKEGTHMKRNSSKLFSTRNLVLMAALAAIQIILARFLSIQATDMLRISFEAVPLALAGMWMGPLAGAVVALISDFLGMCLFGQGTYFPLIVLGPMAYAVICGVGTHCVFRRSLAEARDLWRAAALLIVAEVVNAFVIGPFTTTAYSILVMGNTNAFHLLLWSNYLGRFTSKPITIAIDTVLAVAINRAVYPPVIRKILGRKD